MKRRNFLISGISATASLGVFGGVLGFAISGRKSMALTDSSSGTFEITKTQEEWRLILTPQQFAVLREEGTERAFTSPLNDEKREGIFHCAACDLPAYSSKTKFDSGTGWPSFYQAIENAIGTKPDDSFFMKRTEIHCRRCGGHFGHLFNDGPKPTGQRHCINGVSLKFNPA